MNTKCENYYANIIAISKVARDIVEKANDDGVSCPDNPVMEAVEALNSGKYEILSTEDI